MAQFDYPHAIDLTAMAADPQHGIHCFYDPSYVRACWDWLLFLLRSSEWFWRRGSWVVHGVSQMPKLQYTMPEPAVKISVHGSGKVVVPGSLVPAGWCGFFVFVFVLLFAPLAVHPAVWTR